MSLLGVVPKALLSAVVFGDSPDGEAMEDFSVDNAVFFVFLADGNVA
jgi:hypothetical protein